MDEKTERAILLGVASLTILIFVASKLGSVVWLKEYLGVVPVLLGSTVLTLLLGFVAFRLLKSRPRNYTSMGWSVEGQDRGLLIMHRNSHLTLLRAFEVFSSPKYQETEQWGSSKPTLQNTLEGMTRIGVGATIVTTITHSTMGSESGPPQPLLRTFVIVTDHCDGTSKDDTDARLETQVQALESALMASTRGCKVTSLHEGELASLAERIFYEKAEAEKVSESNCTADVMSSLHLIESKAGDIVEGSTLPTMRDSEGLRIGRVMFAGTAGEFLELARSSVSKHVVVFGATGSGKSNTCKLLVRLFADDGVPVLILDSHNEYLDVAKDAGAIVLELDGSKHLDMLHPFQIDDFSDHVSIVTDAFNNVFHFTASQYFMFREILTQTLAMSKMAGEDAGMAQVVESLEQYSPNSYYENETKFALLRRLKPLVQGEAKKAFVNGSPIKIGDITSCSCDLRLGDIRDADLRNLFTTMALALLYEYRLIQGISQLRHVTFIEESQNVVPYRDRTQEPSLFEKMFFEMRKYGESLVLVAQFPSQVFPDIVKSAGVKVVHRMTETTDSGVAMDLMGLNRRMYSQLKHMPVGRALVLTDLNEEPLTVQFPEFSPGCDDSHVDLATSTNLVS